MQQLQNCLLDKNMILQSDGSLYVGSLLNLHLDGFSLVINPDGSYYYGLFKDSMPCDIGIYKLKNSCLKLCWGEGGTLNNIENIDNQCFLHKVLPFKNNCYGSKLLIKLPFSYGIGRNSKHDGFTIMHYKNGDIYYGNIYREKQDGEGIHYKNNQQEWYWNKYSHGKVTDQLLYGTNLVPREVISKLFNRIHPKTNQIKMVSLQNIQQMIINQLLLNSEMNNISIASTAQPIVDEDLLIYNQQEQVEEIDNRLTKCQTEKAMKRIDVQRQNKFKTQPSEKHVQRQNISVSPWGTPKSQSVYRRSVSPVFTTIRPLFSIIRI